MKCSRTARPASVLNRGALIAGRRLLVAEDDPLSPAPARRGSARRGATSRWPQMGQETVGLRKEGVARTRALVADVDLGQESSGWDVAHRADELGPSAAAVQVSGGCGHDGASQRLSNDVLWPSALRALGPSWPWPRCSTRWTAARPGVADGLAKLDGGTGEACGPSPCPRGQPLLPWEGTCVSLEALTEPSAGARGRNQAACHDRQGTARSERARGHRNGRPLGQAEGGNQRRDKRTSQPVDRKYRRPPRRSRDVAGVNGRHARI